MLFKPNRRRHRLIAFDPGCYEMGVVVLEDAEIIYYGVKTFKRKPFAELIKDIRKIVEKLINEFDPKILLVEKAFFYNNHDNPKLLDVYKEIKVIARKKKLKLFEYAPKTVRKTICNSGKATKREIAQVLSVYYPELSIHVTQDRKWKEKYWQNMFDALGLALTYRKLHP